MGDEPVLVHPLARVYDEADRHDQRVQALRPARLSLFAHNYPAEYLGDTIGALVIAARSHLVVREVGVQMHPRAGGEPSHNPIKSALFLVRATLALAVALTRPGEEVAPAAEENA